MAEETDIQPTTGSPTRLPASAGAPLELLKTDVNELYESEEEALEPFKDGRKIYSQGDCPRCWDADEELVTVDPVCGEHGEEIGRQCRACNWGYVHSENGMDEGRQ